MTAYAKEMTAAGYTKVRAADLQPGDVVRGHLLGEYSVAAADRVVQFVRQRNSSGKAIHYTCGGVEHVGNASKVWAKKG